MKKTTLAILLSMILTTQATYAAEENSNNIVNITINKISESSGLELGTNARARGEGAIATGSNSLAIGKNAVATGGNETQESISKKLVENTQKLNDIETARSSVDTLLNEIQTLRTRQADVIEAGERVKQVIQAKATAKADWKAKQQTYQDAVANNAAFLQEVQGKLDDLNSRLAGMSRIEKADISSEEGLNNAAKQLKTIVEEGTTLNLTDDFYKTYVKSYYTSLGDIRKAQEYASLSDSYWIPENIKFWYAENIISDWNSYAYGRYSSELETFPRFSLDYNEKKLTRVEFNSLEHTFGDKDKLRTYTHNNYSMYFKDINTDITSETEYQNWQSTKEATKADYLTMFLKIGNGLFKIADDPEAKTFFENQQKLKLSIADKAYEATYYQWKYEQTKDTTWLDKKANLIKGYKELVSNYNKLYYQPDSKTKINDIEAYFKYKHNEYVEKNINSITEKNRITTDKLTQDLEAALNINKNAVKDKEKEIAKLKSEADQAKINYESINPTEKDKILGGEYENIMRQLTEKSAELAQSQQKLQELEKSLTLHDLTDVGQSAIAIGTNTLATGSNATSIGTETIATGENAVAIGKSSTVTGSNSIAVGTGHLVVGNNSGSFGDPNVIYGDNSYAVGNNITVGEQNTPHTVGQDTFVLGSDINTTANNAVILGANSVGQDNTVSVGSFGNLRKIINVEKGILAQNSNEVITGGQLYSVLQDAAEVNISNWQRALGTGSNVAGNRGLITGNTLHSALEAQRTEINNNLANIENTKANKDASNLSDEDKSKWQESLGTGKSESGNKGLISGDTLNAALSTKADKSDITNINTNLDNKANKTEVVALKTELTTNVTKITSDLATKANIDASNIDTAKFAEKLGVGTVSENDTNLVTGKTVYAALSNLANNDAVIAKANKDASNLSDEDKSKWQEALGTGTAEVGNTGLINGDTLHTELEKKADKSDVTNITTNLTTKANKDASNISTDDAKKWAEKLGTGTITKGDISLVTGDTVYNTTINKANTDMDNLTDTGKTVIQNLAKGSVKVIAGTNTTVTTSKDGDATTYAVNVSKDAIKAAVQGDLDAKANKDASNISTDDAKKWAEKLGTGTVSENDSNLVSGKTVYAALSNLANNDAVIAKANKDASNLSDEDKSKWQEALGTGTAEVGNTGLISGDTLNTALSEKANKSEVNQKLESKADKDASNIDVAKYTIKLTTGRIELGNTGLINGGQVHGYVQNYVADMSGRTLAQANSYTDYRIGSLKAYTDKRLKDIRDEARAGVASAMAMGAIPMVPNKRFSIGAGAATYHGQNAVAIGLKVKTENDKAIISLTGSASSNGNFGAAAGFAFGF
ncbi:YadA-like family protein [Gallibacterium anatis]|uniref:YadA-like family protein n=1 Tax=Gallibacterium anatis TaxID=750 RepID=UPI0030067345